MPTAPNLTKLPILIAMCIHLFDVSLYSQSTAGQQGFCVHGVGVTLPVGKFLLIRKGTQVGALRLTSISPDTTTKPRVKEWLGTVAYESYFTDAGHTLVDLSAVKTSDQLRFGRIKGFGFHWSWQSGDMTARVGPWKFLFFDEDGLYMTDVNFWNGINHDSGLEFAPTGAASVTELNPLDPRLHWFRYNYNADMPCPIAVPTSTKTDIQASESNVHVQ